MVPSSDHLIVAGVDGYRDGWIIARLEPATKTVSLLVACDVEAALTLTVDCTVIGIDIPLSLPLGPLRPSDAALRSHLGRRSSSLFTTPCRQAIACDDYDLANATNRSITGKGLSKQSWGLAAKIRDARSALRRTGLTPAATEKQLVYEVHPESSFVMLCGHEGLVNKKTAQGVGQRLAALEAQYGSLAQTLSNCPPGPAIDDALDAVAAAWTAARVGTSEALWFGPQGHDDEGFQTAVPV